MTFLFFILTVMSSSFKYIKFNNDYVDFDKHPFLGAKKHPFSFSKEFIRFSDSFLCYDDKDIVRCTEEPTKWVVRLMGNKYKIYTKKWKFGDKKCWENENGKIRLHSCKDKDSQFFQIINIENEDGSSTGSSRDNGRRLYRNKYFGTSRNNESYDANNNCNGNIINCNDTLINDIGDLDINKLFIKNECTSKGLEFLCDKKDYYEDTDSDEIMHKDTFYSTGNCNNDNKMERAAKYIRDNYANPDTVMDFYMNLEKKLSCN